MRASGKSYRPINFASHYTGGFGGTHYIGFIDVKMYEQAPESAQCAAWRGCSELKGKCCPYDDDNAFRGCCAEAEDDIRGIVE